MSKLDKIDIHDEKGINFCCDYLSLESLHDEVEEFAKSEESMNSLKFSKTVMFSHELQYNNLVEGYKDDLTVINDVIKNASRKMDEEKRVRILNLYRGYQFILRHKEINKDSLKDLYAILSHNLITEEERMRMGEYYRSQNGYIFLSSRMDKEPFMTIDPEDVEKLMEEYFKFLDDKFILDTKTGEYIKSQIMHFYLVYIHPYYDVNGRTSRTMAMWDLLNHECYPHIIFNRGINVRRYYYLIERCKWNHNLTDFIFYMLKSVKEEMEKEAVMESINKNTRYELNALHYQTMLYILSMNGLVSVLDFASYYNRCNDKKKVKEIYDELLVPLIDMDILTVERTTNKNMYGNTPNMILRLNQNKIEDNPLVRRIKY